MDPKTLRAVTVLRETRRIRRILTEEEVMAAKKEHFDLVCQITDKEAVAAKQKEELKIAIAPMRRRAAELFQEARQGYVDYEAECYGVDNQADGVMEYYLPETGELVGTRPLRPAERQLSIHTRMEE